MRKLNLLTCIFNDQTRFYKECLGQQYELKPYSSWIHSHSKACSVPKFTLPTKASSNSNRRVYLYLFILLEIQTKVILRLNQPASSGTAIFFPRQIFSLAEDTVGLTVQAYPYRRSVHLLAVLTIPALAVEWQPMIVVFTLN